MESLALGMPDFIIDGYEEDRMAQMCFGTYLMTGQPPAVGQMLYMQIKYRHDGSHPRTSRMRGEVTHVLPRPPPGLYALYAGEQAPPADQLASMRAAELQRRRISQPQLAELEPSFMAGAVCQNCFKPVPSDAIIETYGAVHGQRVLGIIEPEGNSLKLKGKWEVELTINDRMENMYILTGLRRPGTVPSSAA